MGDGINGGPANRQAQLSGAASKFGIGRPALNVNRYGFGLGHGLPTEGGIEQLPPLAGNV